MKAQILQNMSRAWSSGTVLAHLFTIGFLLAWWGYSLIVPAYQLPGPAIVAQRAVTFLTDSDDIAQLLLSLFHVSVAIVAAFVIGCALAALAQYVEPLRLLIDGRLTPFLNAFSAIGWLFLAMLWFGLDSFTVIFAVTLILIPFTIINVRTGLQELDGDLIELGHSLSRNPLQLGLRIVIPLLVPYLFAALRNSFGVSWKVVLTAELFGGSGGVGYLLNIARQQFDTETIFAVIGFILVFVAFAEIVLFRPIQRHLDRSFGRG
ncbi:MAG: ABC transporter permease subunit [Pseudolabrys sp.]|jgi:ABC-type nitrate/sulfonate/bicarbonate transport system permease component